MTPTASQLKQRVAAGEALLGTFLNLGSPLAAEVCGRAGFDWALVDLEHGAGTEAGLIPTAKYPKGSWGPPEAEKFLARDDRRWQMGCWHEE